MKKFDLGCSSGYIALRKDKLNMNEKPTEEKKTPENESK